MTDETTPITDSTDLLKNSRRIWEMMPGSVVRRQEILYFRAEEVIALLKQRNATMQTISDRLARLVARRREEEAKRVQDRQALRTAIAELIATEGCGCCSDYDKHEAAKAKLGRLLDVPMYSDGSGYDFNKFREK